jgi:hypothetical protein
MATKISAKCLNCEVEFTYSRASSTGKYCSNKCSGEHKKKLTRSRIEAGENIGDGGLREFLIEKFGEVCCECGVGAIWNGRPLTLHMDHKDGDSDNNHFSNVQLLCPNCHTQTPTFGAKGRGSRYKKVTKRNTYLQAYKSGEPATERRKAEMFDFICPVCSNEFSRSARDMRIKRAQKPGYIPTCSRSCGRRQFQNSV